MTLPACLAPTATESVVLPSGATVLLPKATPRFRAWKGPAPADRYGGKALLDFEGRPTFAELFILWTLQSAGWQGAWVDTYHRRFRSGYWDDAPDVVLPGRPSAVLEAIYAKARSRSGAFDVVAWRDGHILFAESKWRGKDHIRDTQRRWVEAALTVGVALDQLLIVEWSCE